MDFNSDILSIDKKKCINCGLCVKSCVKDIIDLEKYEIDNDKCFKCFHCFSICPKDAIKYGNIKPVKLQNFKIKPNDFENLIYKRRSSRNYLDKKIPGNVFKSIAEIVRYSPTATNSQAVYLTVLDGKSKVKKLSDEVMIFFKNLSKYLNKFTSPFFSIIIGKSKIQKALSNKKFLAKYFEGKNILTYDAPCLLLFHSPKDKSVMAVDDCNIAASYVSLYLETLGLSSCFIGFIVNAFKYNKKLYNLAGIPKNHIVHTALTVGYPKLKYLKKTIRDNPKINFI